MKNNISICKLSLTQKILSTKLSLQNHVQNVFFPSSEYPRQKGYLSDSTIEINLNKSIFTGSVLFRPSNSKTNTVTSTIFRNSFNISQLFQAVPNSFSIAYNITRTELYSNQQNSIFSPALKNCKVVFYQIYIYECLIIYMNAGTYWSDV